MRFSVVSLIGLLALALSGCGGVRAVATTTVAPEQNLVPVAVAAGLAEIYCAAHAPTFVTADRHLRFANYTQRLKTETFYHPTLDLSINISPRDGNFVCSIGFGSRAEPDEMIAAFLPLSESFEGDRMVIREPRKGYSDEPSKAGATLYSVIFIGADL